MADATTTDLRKRTHYLRNAAPREFKAFEEALNAWAGQKLAMITGLSPAQLPQFQGQMQALEQVLTFLKDSVATPVD